MGKIEQRLQQRFPHWFNGRRARLSRPLLRTLGRWSRLQEVDRFLEANAHLRGFGFVSAELDYLGTRYSVDPAPLRVS